MVRARAAERATHLDGVLWTYRDDSFLPHGPDDEPGAARQPILITTGFENPNGADVLFLVDGAEPGDLAGYVRCVVLFDSADEVQLSTARSQFKAAKDAGLAVSYWKQQPRGWEKQA